MSLFERTNVQYDIEQILREWESIRPKIVWYGKGSQTALQYAEGQDCPYTDPCGSFTNRVGKTVNEEKDITVLTPAYKNTIFETIIKEQNAYRMRVLCRKKQTTYTIHTDVTPFRFHLALITNPDSYVVYPNRNKLYHVPADGYVYRVDTSVPHTVMNCGPDRYHLVWGSISQEEKHVKYTSYTMLKYAGY